MAEKKADIQKGIQKFLSRHHRGEAYGFDIKLPKIDIPTSVRKRVPEDVIVEIAQKLAQSDLYAFMSTDMQRRYPWISDWSQEGRSGGWLVIIPFDDAGVVDDDDHVNTVKVARKRLKDLRAIQGELDKAIEGHINDLESSAWWDEAVPRGVLEWSPD